MLEMFLQSKAGASLAGGIGKGLGDALGGGGGPLVSGGTVDARSMMDGSGWTVSTGSSRATGGRAGGATMGQPTPAYGWGGGVEQAGMNPLLMLALGGGMLWAILKR